MTRRGLGNVLGLARLPILATVAVVVALGIAPGRRDLFIHIYLIALVAFALATLVERLRRVNPVVRRSPFDLALRRRPPRRERLQDLERIERELALALQTAADLHFRLRPRLRRIAAQLLATRRGIDLDTDPAMSRRVLGNDLWEVVRPDREAPRRRDAPSLDLPAATRLVTSLEEI